MMSIGESRSSLEASDEVASVGSILIMFPRPTEDLYSSSHAMKQPELALDTSLATMTNSSSQILVDKMKGKGAPDFPPTPPTYSRQSSMSHGSSNSASPNTGCLTSGELEKSSLHTLHRQQSPPTPEMSPPRESRPALLQFNSNNCPSSGSNSFKTAREDPNSSDEDNEPVMNQTLSYTQKPRIDVGIMYNYFDPMQKRPEFYSTELEQGPKSRGKLRAQSSQAMFNKFDGEWGSSLQKSHHATGYRNFKLTKNNVVSEQPIRHSHITPPQTEDETALSHRSKKITRALSLQDHTPRSRQSRPARRSSAEILSPRRVVPSPILSTYKPKELPPIPIQIEATPFDSLSVRQKTLRHTKKCVGLRNLSDLTCKSSVLNHIKTNDRKHTSSSNSFKRTHSRVISTGSIGSTLSMKHCKEVIRNGGIPVLVIPERLTRSKSKPPSLRSTSSRRTRRSASLGSAPWSYSTKYYHPEFSDRAGIPSRMVSVSTKSGHSVRTIDYPPSVPTRRSSLSARTSSNASRTGSLTAESLKVHNLLHAKKPTLEVKPYIEIPAIELSGLGSNLALDHNGDSVLGNRLSSQITPFSQISNETTGTLAEVSEALAVSLFPHQNKSLVLVQNRQSPEPSPPTPTVKLNKEINSVIPDSNTKDAPTISLINPTQPIDPSSKLDSPFSNPRDPPEPPIHKTLLSVNVKSGPSYCMPVESQSPAEVKLPRRTMSLIRRKSSRSASEPPQSLGFIRRTLSASFRPKFHSDTVRNSTPKRQISSDLHQSAKDKFSHNNRLHSFWRPAKFWDNLNDDDHLWDKKHTSPDKSTVLPSRMRSEQLKKRIRVLPVDEHNGFLRTYFHRKPVSVSHVHERIINHQSKISRKNDDIKRISCFDKEMSLNYRDKSFGSGFKKANTFRTRTFPGLSLGSDHTRWIEIRRLASERKRSRDQGVWL